VDADLAFRLGGDDVPTLTRQDPEGPRYGLLNVLCAVRAALNGAEVAALSGILAEPTPAPLTSALRRMSEADAAVTRGFLAGVQVRDVTEAVAGLVGLALLAED
jgi:hypothetical protein